MKHVIIDMSKYFLDRSEKWWMIFDNAQKKNMLTVTYGYGLYLFSDVYHQPIDTYCVIAKHVHHTRMILLKFKYRGGEIEPGAVWRKWHASTWKVTRSGPCDGKKIERKKIRVFLSIMHIPVFFASEGDSATMTTMTNIL